MMATRYWQSSPESTAFPQVEPSAARASSPSSDSVTVTVTGFDGTVIATITRSLESASSAGEPAVVVISIAGDIDNDSAPALRQALLRVLRTGVAVCCDLSRVEFFGAAGANTVLEAHRQAAETGVTFTVRGVHGLTGRILDLSGITRQLVITD
jgi:anti-sigma B factor antagonist